MKNSFLKFGGIYAVYSIISVLLWYNGIIGMGLSSVSSIVILFLIFWIAAREQKSQNEGFATFGELFKLFFLITIIGMVTSLVFNLVYNNLITDELKDEIVERTIQSQLSMYKSFGTGEDLLITMEEKFREDMTAEKMFGLMNTLTTMITSFFIAMIFALIGGGLFKKVPKEV